MSEDGRGNPFHEEDPRYAAWNTLESLKTGSLTREQGEAAVEQYKELTTCVFARFKEMVDNHNMFTVEAIPYLTIKPTETEVREGMARLMNEWDTFMDLMLTVSMLRSMESAGKVDVPFTIKISQKEDAGDAGINN